MKKCENIILLFLIFSTIIFSSCNNPLHRTYNIATYEDDMEAIRKSNKVSDEDLDLMNKYIVLIKLAGNNITGESYDEILDKIKAIQQKNNEFTNGNTLVKDAKRQRLSQFLEVKFQNKIFTKKDNKSVMAYTVLFKNIGAPKIKTITGVLEFDDLLEKPFKSINIFIDEDIASKATLTKTFYEDYNDANESDRSMRSKDIFNVRAIWNPDKIIFENGKMAE